MVAGGISEDNVAGILHGNNNLIDTIDRVIPGVINFQLHLAGKTIIKINSTSAVTLYMSYDSVNPSKINHDQTIQYNDFMANVGVEIELRVVLGTKNFYISAYNYEDKSAVVSISMFSDSATSDLVPNPIPI